MSTVPSGDAATRGPRALYATRGSFSHTNEKLLTALEEVLPDVQFDRFDISALMRKNYPALLRCVFGALRESDLSSLTSRESLRYRIIRSQAYFDVSRKMIADHIAKQPYDFIVQTQSLFNAKMPGIPTVAYTDHVACACAGERKANIAGLSDAWFESERAIYEDVDHVFTFGPSVSQLLTDVYKIPSEKHSAIGGGASVEPKRPVQTELERYARRNILFVGVEWERKGGPELVEAFHALRKRLPDATLKIIGCSPDIENVDGIEILGRLPLDALEEHFHQASCLCVPSRLEPFGVVFAEAMHFGLPVVSTDVCDIGAIVRHGETGLLAQLDDIQGLSDALYDTLESAERCQEMARKALERSQYFTWQAVARQIAEKLPVTPRADVPLLEPTW